MEWVDGFTSWEPKRNILDRQMMRKFEDTYRGLDEGIDILASRTRKVKQQYRVHWHGRPAREDGWADERLVNPTRIGKVQASGFDGQCG